MLVTGHEEEMAYRAEEDAKPVKWIPDTKTKAEKAAEKKMWDEFFGRESAPGSRGKSTS